MASFDVISRLVQDDVALLVNCAKEPHAANLQTSAQCLETIQQHVTNAFFSDGSTALAPHEKQLVVHVLLSAEPSLWSFVDIAVSSETIASSSIPAKALQGVFSCCCLLLEIAPSLVQHTQLIKMRRVAFDVFLLLSRLAQHQMVQAEALRVLRVLQKELPNSLTAAEFDVKSILSPISRAATRSTAQTTRSEALQVIGKLCKTFPTELAAESRSVKSVLLEVLQQLAAKAEPENTVGEGLLLAFDDYLCEFSVGADEHGEGAYLPKLYAFVKSALHLAESTSRYVFSKAALKLLKHRAFLFKELLATHAVEWLGLMEALCGHKNVELHKSAYPAAIHVLQAIAFEMCEDTKLRTPSQNSELLSQLLSKTKALLSQQGKPYSLSFAIVAYGMLAKPIARYCGAQPLLALFEELAGRCESLFSTSSQDVMEDSSRHIPAYLSTFACLLLEIDKSSPAINDAVDSMLHTMLLVYPKQYYFPKVRLSTPSAVLKVLVACRRHGGQLSQNTLPSFVRRALAFSIGSSAMFIGADQSSSNRNYEPGEGALYEEYLELWRGLMDADVRVEEWGYPWTHASGCGGAIEDERGALRQECLSQAIELVGCFDLALVVAAPQAHAEPTAAAHHMRIAVQDGFVSPKTPKDYSLFLNLVSLFGSLAPLALRRSNASFLSWVLHYCSRLIDLSIANPHVSGFYTCLGDVLQVLQHNSDSAALSSQDEEVCQLRNTLSHFHQRVSKQLSEYTHELLYSSCKCLVQFPLSAVPVERQAVAVQHLLDLGRDFEPAATSVITAVEYWLQHVPDQLGNTILPIVLSAMPQDFAQGQQLVDSGSTARLMRLVGKYGLLLSSVAARMQEGGSSTAAVSVASLPIDSEKRLRIVLPLRDCSVDFRFGRILSRVMTLSRQSPDRKVRVAASELLHGFVMWLLGASNVRSSAVADFSGVLQSVFPAVVELATSTDQVLIDLFLPLVEGLARWYAQNTSTHHKETASYLDALCDGLSSPTKASMRSVCSGALLVFLQWSLRNSGDGGNANATLLMRRLVAMLHHPSSWSHLGASVAFSKLYVHFREMDKAVAEHTLDLVYYAFFALQTSESDSAETGSTQQLKTMLLHLEKIVVVRAPILLQRSSNSSSRFASLKDLVSWLFQQCGCIEPVARGLAMRLFTTFCTCLPEFDADDGPMRWLSANRQAGGSSNEAFFGVLFDGFTMKSPRQCIGKCMALPKYVDWCREICATAECHQWLLSSCRHTWRLGNGRRTTMPKSGGSKLLLHGLRRKTTQRIKTAFPSRVFLSILTRLFTSCETRTRRCAAQMTTHKLCGLRACGPSFLRRRSSLRTVN